MQNTAKQNYPGLVASHDTQPGNEWAYSKMLPRPHGSHGFLSAVVAVMTLKVIQGHCLISQVSMLY